MDVSFYALKALAAIGVVSDLRTPPARIRRAHLEGDAATGWAAEAP